MDDFRNERDSEGNLTDFALAFDALMDNGCDCGTDEPRTCLACVCERALWTERDRAEKAEKERDDAIRQREAWIADKPFMTALLRAESAERERDAALDALGQRGGGYGCATCPALSGCHVNAGSGSCNKRRKAADPTIG